MTPKLHDCKNEKKKKIQYLFVKPNLIQSCLVWFELRSLKLLRHGLEICVGPYI